MMSLSVSSPQTAVKGKGHPPPRPQPFLFVVHTQQIETPKAMDSTVPNSFGGCGLCTQLHSTTEPEGPRLEALVLICLGNAFEGQFTLIIMFEPCKILSKAVITPLDRGENSQSLKSEKANTESTCLCAELGPGPSKHGSRGRTAVFIQELWQLSRARHLPWEFGEGKSNSSRGPPHNIVILMVRK